MIPGFSSKFECKVSGQKESLTVLDFDFLVSLSQLYVCKIELVSTNPNLDYWSFVDKNATLTVNVKGANALQYVNGIITEFVQKGVVGKGYSYEIMLEPHLSQMKHQEKTEVFLNEKIPDIIEFHLKQAKIQHYRLDLSQTYNPREFVCQFQETDFNFISRWMEHEGIYYYFEQGTDFETLVLTDRYSTHKDHEHFSELKYNQENITGTAESSYVVKDFVSRISKVAKTLELKGYNYNDDTKTIVTETQVSSHGMGTVEIYDENVLNEQDAKRIAEIRAQEISCKEQIYTGKTLASNIVPGYRFKLINHFRGNCNQEYLVFDVVQKGSQRQVALSYLGLQSHYDQENEVVFTTEFKAIPGRVQYRAPLVTPAKRIDGIIPAILDAETSGEYAQLDDQGRYKIRLLHSDKPDGQASDWVRKMESYIGNQYGNHFPMHKNAEICLAFQFGNPDRPIIIGAVHNSSNKNLVSSKNQKRSITRSASGNVFVMGDQKGQEYTHIYSPSGTTSLVLGDVAAASLNASTGDQTTVLPWPNDWPYQSHKPGENLRENKTVGGDSASNTQGNSYSYTEGDTYSYQKGNANSTTQGNKNFTTYGDSHTISMGNSTSTTHGNSNSTTWGNSFSKTMGASESFNLSNSFSMTLGASESITAGVLSASVTGTALVTSMTLTGIKIDYTKSGKTFDFKGDDVVNTVTGDWLSNISGSYVTNAVSGMTMFAGASMTIDSGVDMNISSTSIQIEATTSLTLTCGASSIEITPAGITITSGPSEVMLTPELLGLSAGASGIIIADAGITGSSPMSTFGP